MQAKACFFKHELSLINHELTINGWRGLLFLRVIALRIANPYSILRQIANLPQRTNLPQLGIIVYGLQILIVFCVRLQICRN
jgi:hypothetical protein